MRVVDASVALSWLLPDQRTPAGRSLLDGHLSGRDRLVAPELLHYEVANVLVTGAHLPARLAREAYAHFVGLEIETYSLGTEEYDAALLLAARHRVTVYDGSYAALALALGCRMVTSDRRLARALEKLAIVDEMRA